MTPEELKQALEAIEPMKEMLPELITARYQMYDRVLDQPDLPAGHPDADVQNGEKARARKQKEELDKEIAELSKKARASLHMIMDMPPAPPGDPAEAEVKELKLAARVKLLEWDTNYGPGGPLERLRPLSNRSDED